MSSFLVPVAQIDKILPHPNAERLEIAHVLGWQLVIPKGSYTEGSKVVYFPIDTVLPLELSDRLGVTKYLSKQRIRCARLRGEPSFGLAIKPDDEGWQVGENVAEYYHATRYLPPFRVQQGDAEEDHPLFVRYTEIENMRNFPDIFQKDEDIIVTEKLHGTSCRVAMIEGELMAGSMRLRRKRPEDFASNTYWFPLSLNPIRTMLEELGKRHKQVILFGEVYGSKIQSFSYGLNNQLGFRAFDLLLDGRYCNWTSFYIYCKQYGVEIVPVIPALHTFSLEKIKKASEGKTFLMKNTPHIREGVVVKPFQERTDPRVGRVILKYVSDSYLFGETTDYTEN